MKTTAEIIEYLDRQIETAERNGLNPDRRPDLREQDILNRRSLMLLRAFIIGDEKKPARMERIDF